MSHAEVCPCCHGTGKKAKSSVTTSKEDWETCNCCEGLGWVTVHDTYYPISYVPYFPEDQPPNSPWYPYHYQLTITCVNRGKLDNWEG